MSAPGGPGPTVAVIGGGIAGLAAAWELSGRAGPARPKVVVLEAGERAGGKLKSAELAGLRVDLGADGFLARRPEAVTLCAELDMTDDLVPVGRSGAAVWARGRLRPMPAGLVLGVPTRVRPLARSGILGPAALARLALDTVVPRPDTRGPLGDRAVGPLVARKLGQGVVDQLVDPLVGGIHAGTTADMSAAAVFPMLLEAAQRPGSFMRSLRRVAEEGTPHGPAQTEGQPAFWAVRGGMATLVDRLTAALGARGVEVRPRSTVRALRRGTGGERAWLLDTASGALDADGVVVATPAPAAARLLEPHEDEAARLLATFDHSDVAVVTVVAAKGALPADLHGTGALVPRVARTPRRATLPHAGEGRGRAGERRFLVTAVTYLSAKWPHLAGPDHQLVRASLGRWDDERGAALDDEQLEERVLAELEMLTGLGQPPLEVLVTRWPAAFPQYRVHHLLRVAAIEAAVSRLPALAVAGASYHGVGIPACIASGRAAAGIVLAGLSAPARSG